MAGTNIKNSFLTSTIFVAFLMIIGFSGIVNASVVKTGQAYDIDGHNVTNNVSASDNVYASKTFTILDTPNYWVNSTIDTRDSAKVNDNFTCEFSQTATTLNGDIYQEVYNGSDWVQVCHTSGNLPTTDTNYTCNISNYVNAYGDTIVRCRATAGAGTATTFQFDYLAINFTTLNPGIEFKSPTPANGTIQCQNWTEVNVSIAEQLLDTFKFNWNGTNTTIYDSSLVLGLNFNNISGENYHSPSDLDTVKDFSKYGNNGTTHNGITYNSTGGKYGGAFEFDGVNDYISVPDANSLDVTTTFTHELRVKFNNLSTTPDMFAKSSATGYEPFRMNFGSNNVNLQLSNTSSNRVFPTYSINWNLGKWYHIVTTFNNGEVKFYIDGELKSTVSSGITSIYASNGLLYIGTRNAGSNFLNGTIDEVRIYNRALSADEVKMHYLSNLAKHSEAQFIYTLNQTPLEWEYYNYSAWVNDTEGDSNSTETRILTIDTTPPTINFTSPTPTNNTTFYNIQYIPINISANLSCCFKNITIYLYNANGTLHQAQSTATENPFFWNFTNIPYGTYYYNATVENNCSKNNKTETRVIQLIKDINPPVIYFTDPTTQAGEYAKYIEANISAEDPNLDTITFYLYNQKTGELVANATSNTSPFYVEVTDLYTDTYYIRVMANDTAGNTNSTEIHNLKVSAIELRESTEDANLKLRVGFTEFLIIVGIGLVIGIMIMLLIHGWRSANKTSNNQLSDFFKNNKK